MWPHSVMKVSTEGVGWVHDSSRGGGTHIWALLSLFFFFFLALFYTILIPISLYLVWVYSSLWGGIALLLLFASPLFARSHWPILFDFSTWRRYFEIRVHKEERFAQSRNVLLAFVPHGMFPLALPMLSSICNEIFPEFKGQIPRTAVAEKLFWVPLISPLLTWLGCIPAKKEEIQKHLRETNVVIVPDGIAGIFHSKREEECVYIESRRGFIKTAIEQESLLVPVYCFGHSQLYDVYPSHESWLARLSRWLQFSIIWFWGQWWCPPLPHRVPLLVVIGKGIPVKQTSDPEYIHLRFKQELTDLYYRHSETVPGYQGKKLIIL